MKCSGSNNKDCYEGCTHFGNHEQVKHWATKEACTEWHLCELTGEAVRCENKSIQKKEKVIDCSINV